MPARQREPDVQSGAFNGGDGCNISGGFWSGAGGSYHIYLPLVLKG
jgi:hypothetical protein